MTTKPAQITEDAVVDAVLISAHTKISLVAKADGAAKDPDTKMSAALERRLENLT